MNETDQMILLYIRHYWRVYWTSPSYREIGKRVGLSSTSSVSQRLNKLVRQGYLETRERPDVRRTVLYRVTTRGNLELDGHV